MSSSLTAKRRRKLIQKLSDPEYRRGYVAAEVSDHIAFQIRAMRHARGWTQKEPGERVGMKQGAIGRLESFDYKGYSVDTLRRIAEAFDVGLTVSFTSFGDMFNNAVRQLPDDLVVPEFSSDSDLVCERGVDAAPSGSQGDACREWRWFSQTLSRILVLRYVPLPGDLGVSCPAAS